LVSGSRVASLYWVWRESKGITGVVQPGEGKAPGRSYWDISVLKGVVRKMETNFLAGPVAIGPRGNGFKLKES